MNDAGSLRGPRYWEGASDTADLASLAIGLVAPMKRVLINTSVYRHVNGRGVAFHCNAEGCGAHVV